MRNRLVKSIGCILAVAMLIMSFASCGKKKEVKANVDTKITATFLGVKDYKNATRDMVLTDSSAIYQFEVDGETKEYSVKCSEDDYSIQNRLMMGYKYAIEVENNQVVSAEILDKDDINGVVSGYTAGKKTVKNFLFTASSLLGKVSYVYGGGWNFQDDGSSYMSRTIGISPTWEKFYKTTDENYSFEKDTYPDNEWNTFYYAGLDCSGYAAWVLYNTLYSETEKEEGFVTSSTKMAKSLADANLGTFEHPTETDYRAIVDKLHAGDIVSLAGHVYIVLGVCDDDSMVVIHSTVTKSVTDIEGGGVQISAVSVNGDDDTSCDAYKLADKYMKKYYPEWVKKYPVVMKPASYYFNFPSDRETSGIFTWNTDESGLEDTENVRQMSAEQVLEMLFDK